jgi:hypothetical protein
MVLVADALVVAAVWTTVVAAICAPLVETFDSSSEENTKKKITHLLT